MRWYMRHAIASIASMSQSISLLTVATSIPHGYKTRIALFVVNAPAARRMALLTVVFQVKPGYFLIGIANRIRHPRDRLRTVVELDLVVGLKGTAGKSAIGKRKRKHGKHDAFHG